MDNSFLFTIESKEELSKKDFIFLRIQYSSLVGKTAINLYSLISDFHEITSDKRVFHNFSDIKNILGVSFDELLLARKKLEAVGLLSVFKKDYENKYILTKIMTMSRFQH